MPHIRHEEPLNICSEKVQDHGSTSWVRSLVKENYRTVKPPPELHIKTLHKPSCKNITARKCDDCLKDDPTTFLRVPQPSQGTQIWDGRQKKGFIPCLVTTPKISAVRDTPYTTNNKTKSARPRSRTLPQIKEDCHQGSH
jgi:hypothetical protein